MSITTNSSKKKLFDGRKMWFIFAGIASVAVAILAFSIMRGVTATDTYYVLSKDIPARTQITPNMLTEVVTSAGKTPPTALGLSDITSDTYSLYSLKKGDILTTSNTGGLTALTAGLPKDFVVASFTANPSVAAGGNIKRGDYVDIMVVTEDQQVTGSPVQSASYVLQRVLVVDATTNLDNSSNSSGSSTSSGTEGSDNPNSTGTTSDTTIRQGVPTMFTVGVSQKDAAVLAIASKYSLYVVLSSADSVDGKVPAAPAPNSASGIWGNAPDAGVGTDNTFGQGGTKKKSNSGSSSTPTPSTTKEPSAPTTPSDTPSPESTDGASDGSTPGSNG